jgi:hypothetical protein
MITGHDNDLPSEDLSLQGVGCDAGLFRVASNFAGSKITSELNVSIVLRKRQTKV